ncbi:MAG: hypothetical protein JST00_00085 [Deltaproteobacteria bacterium]|nr:hypothetical protein [Deltaproteobacteria bacterium]
MPYRIPSPPPPEEPESEEPYAAVIRAQRTRGRLLTAFLCLAIVGGAAKVARSSQQQHPRARSMEADRIGNARAAIGAAHLRATAAQTRFDHAMREAIGDDVGPREDLGACPIRLAEPSSLVRGRASFPLLTIERADLKESLPSQAVAAVLADVRRAEKHVAAGRYEEAALYARALDRDDRFDFDVVLVAKHSTRPRALSGTEFVPGEITGRAYVYDFRSGKVVCAADITAKSSKEIGYVFSDRHDAPADLGAVAMMTEAIEEDLRFQTERAIAREMKLRAGAPRGDAATR